ncbi:MAG: hypothetical protein ACMUHX_05040 [bacterium]
MDIESNTHSVVTSHIVSSVRDDQDKAITVRRILSDLRSCGHCHPESGILLHKTPTSRFSNDNACISEIRMRHKSSTYK